MSRESDSSFILLYPTYTAWSRDVQDQSPAKLTFQRRTFSITRAVMLRCRSWLADERDDTRRISRKRVCNRKKSFGSQIVRFSLPVFLDVEDEQVDDR